MLTKVNGQWGEYMVTKTRETISVKQEPLTASGYTTINSAGYPVGTGKVVTAEVGGEFIPNHFKYTACNMVFGQSFAPYETYSPASNFYCKGNWMSYAMRSTMNYYWWYRTPMHNYSAYLVSAARIKAANKRLDNAYAGGVFLGELKESLSMLINPLKGGLKLLRNGFKRSKKFRTKARRKEYLSSWWLEARYGWMPLASDISEIHQRICLGVQRSSKFFTTHGSEREEKALVTRGAFAPSSMWQVGYVRVETWKTRIRSTHGWNYVVGHENGELMSLMGLHYHDIPGIAWELVPLSFVVDWWFKVGDFLQYLRPTPYLYKQGEGYSVTTEYRRVYIPEWTKYKINGRSFSDVHPSKESCVITQNAYSRIIPTAPVSAPVLDTRFKSVKHLADAGALLIQKLWR